MTFLTAIAIIFGMTTFSELGSTESIVKALDCMGIKIPTPIQAATIPIALKGSDLLASAQTGSGKTIAYSIPMLMKLVSTPGSAALILTPTRELATQVHQALLQLVGKTSPFRTALLIGGESMFRQYAQLKARPQIIVGTPGRITDHLVRGSLSLKKTNFLIIDEADRMLDMGFGIQLDKIAEYLSADRQTLMFSATFPANIEKLSKKYLRDPIRVAIDIATQAAPKIKQEVIYTSPNEKFAHLLKELSQRQGSVIVFVKTKRSADRLSGDLNHKGLIADAIHGDLPQRRRDRVIHDFRKNRTRILVATDIAARGLDIPHIMHVINYDLPQCAEDYIHRIGRTARAGAEGNALCLIAPEDGYKWKAILRLMNPQEAQKLGGDRPRPNGPGPNRGPSSKFGFRKRFRQKM